MNLVIGTNMITPKLKSLLKMYEIAYKANNASAIAYCSDKLAQLQEEVKGKEHDPVVLNYLIKLKKVHQACKCDLLGANTGHN